jgi:magnesium-transporting ATPase (P-type)
MIRIQFQWWSKKYIKINTQFTQFFTFFDFQLSVRIFLGRPISFRSGWNLSGTFFPCLPDQVLYCVSCAGKARGVVIATGDRTLMGRIASIAARMEMGEETLIAQEITRFVFILTGVGFFVSLLFFFISLILGFCWTDALMYLVGLIIACVPEGLLATITVCNRLTSHHTCIVKC